MDKKTELDEATVKASRGPNEVEDTVTPQGGSDHKRDADDTSEKEKMEKAKKAGKMAEAVDAMFEGEDFSEEFKEKVKVVFEAAVLEEVNSRVEELEEEFNKKVSESISTELDEIIESVDSYLDIVSTKWLEENKLAIENTRKVEMAESFIDGLSYLFKEHNLEVDQADVDVISELEDTNDVLKSKINEMAKTLKESRQVIRDFERKEVIGSISEGLSASDKDRMTTLTEAIEFSSIDEFKRKASIIKENFFTSTTSDESDLENLNEEGSFAEPEVKSTDAMSMLSEALKRINNPY